MWYGPLKCTHHNNLLASFEIIYTSCLKKLCLFVEIILKPNSYDKNKKTTCSNRFFTYFQ